MPLSGIYFLRIHTIRAPSCLPPSLLLPPDLSSLLYHYVSLPYAPFPVLPSHPSPRALFSCICPPHKGIPSCQYGPGIRQRAVSQAIIHSGRQRACIVPGQSVFPASPIGIEWGPHPVAMGSSFSTDEPLIQYLLHCRYICLIFRVLYLQL